MKHKTIYISILVLSILFTLGIGAVHSKASSHKDPLHYRSSRLQSPIVAQRDNTNASNKIQIALILDTSNSMDGLIGQAKTQLWNIVNELAKAQKDTISASISIALYEYGNDNNSISNGYIRKVLPFTTDLDDISEKLFSLSTRGGNEYCGQAIQTSINQLEWEAGSEAMKVIYIAGNEPFDQGPVSHTEACELASQNDISVYPIFCGKNAEGRSTQWTTCANLTAGTYMNIDSDIETIAIATPYDDQIDSLNERLNKTYIHYGTNGSQMKSKQITQDENQEMYSKANKVSRIMSKSSKVYKNGSWDLLDAYSSDSAIIGNLDKSTLPDSLQTLKDEELKVVVTQNALEREKIKQNITQLGAQRSYYISTNAPTAGENTLGDQMIKSIRIEAQKNGFIIKN